MTKLIIFDWDDVITLRSKEGYFKCYHEALDAVGIHLSPEEELTRIIAKWGKHHREELKELLKENLGLVNKACEVYEQKFFGDTFINELKILDGTQELLKRLSKKYILAISTGQHPKMFPRIEKKFSIPGVFSQIIFAYDICDPEKQKPNPYSLLKIMKNQKAKPEETVFIGDARTDMIMAQNAGVTPIAVLTGQMSKSEAEKLGVKYIIKDVRDLEKVLEKIKLE